MSIILFLIYLVPYYIFYLNLSLLNVMLSICLILFNSITLLNKCYYTHFKLFDLTFLMYKKTDMWRLK